MEKDIYTVYASKDDMTFIMEDVKINDDEIETHVRGFYYGVPSDDATKKYYGCL